MPADALPVATPAPVAGSVTLRREYRDILGRPMTGSVRITGAKRTQAGHSVITSAAVTAPVVAGVLSVALPAGSYSLAASLTTVDGNRADDTETVTLD